MPDDLITVAEARSRVLGTIRPLADELLDIAAALDRVLARDVVVAGDVPPFASSAMDGYALAPGPGGRTVKVVGESRAGAPSGHALGAGEAVRISTGAALPNGATAVVRQEDTELRGEEVYVAADLARGENVRLVAEDLRAGTTVLTAGRRLGVSELGAAVAAGAGQVRVARQPRVSILCTGDELRAPGEPLGPGEIHNSNAPMLAALATRAGALIQQAGRVADDREQTEAALRAALGESDVVVISGGVSVGPHDHVKPALSALEVGELFWGVALQPGKPTWFGARDQQLVFGLPGNPVSAVVTFTLFASPALAALQGLAAVNRGPREARLGASVRRNPRREQALRVRLEDHGEDLVAVPNGPQNSHLVSSLLGADALAMIPAGSGELAAGARVSLETLPR